MNPTRRDRNRAFVHGFTGGEDPEMCFAMLFAGYKLWYEPKLIYKHSIQKARLTEKFLLDMVRGAALPVAYLRLFLPI